MGRIRQLVAEQESTYENTLALSGLGVLPVHLTQSMHLIFLHSYLITKSVSSNQIVYFSHVGNPSQELSGVLITKSFGRMAGFLPSQELSGVLITKTNSHEPSLHPTPGIENHSTQTNFITPLRADAGVYCAIAK